MAIDEITLRDYSATSNTLQILVDTTRVTVRPEDFGAVGDGVTDDSGAMQAAYDSVQGGTVQLLSKEYAIGSTLVLGGEGGTLAGIYGANSDGGTRLKALPGCTTMIKIERSYRVAVHGMYLNGNNEATDGIWCHTAARDLIQAVFFRNFLGAGILLDITGGGNNNVLAIKHCTFHVNERGIRTVEGSDNNVIGVSYCDFISNTKEAILLKGASWTVDHCHFDNNDVPSGDKYAIRISEPGDSGFSIGTMVMNPWLESGQQVCGGGKSKDNQLMQLNPEFTGRLVNLAGSFDLATYPRATTAAGFAVDGGYGTKFVARAGTASVSLYTEGDAGTLPLYLRPKGAGAGHVHVNDLGAGGMTIGGSANAAITAHRSGTAAYAGGTINAGTAYTQDISVTGAVAGDTVTVGLDSLTTEDIRVDARVISAGQVRIWLRNDTGGNIALGAGTFRADSWQH